MRLFERILPLFKINFIVKSHFRTRYFCPQIMIGLMDCGTTSLNGTLKCSGETARLSNLLVGKGIKPMSPFDTSLGKRYVDRVVNDVAYESKAGWQLTLC